MWNRTLASSSLASKADTISSSPLMNVDILIIGAGQAGMAAAHRLLGRNYDNMHVIEAHPHVGGRTRNFCLDSGAYDVATDNAIELGGTWLSPNHTAFLDLCRELNIELFNASFINEDTQDDAPPAKTNQQAQSEEGAEEWPWWYWGADYSEDEMKLAPETIFHSIIQDSSAGIKEHRRFRFRSPGELKREMDPRTLQELEMAGEVVKASAAQMKDLSWDAVKPGGHWSELDKLSTSARLMPNLNTLEGRNILRSVIHTMNAQEPEQVGFLYNLISFKGCNSAGPDSQFRVRGGTQAVPLAIAKELGPDRLTLGDPVQSVHIEPSLLSNGNSKGQQITVRTRTGRVFIAKALVLTGSPPAVMGIEFSPPLPAVQAQLLQRMPMGTSMKFIAVYRNGPWWRSYGLTGDVLASRLPEELSLPVELSLNDGSGETVEYLPIFGQCFDTSPFSREFGVLTCFIEGRQNLHFAALSQEQQRDLMRKFLMLTFADLPGSQSRSQPSGLRAESTKSDKELWEPDSFVSYNWADDPHSRGAYTAYFPPGVLSVPEWWQAYREMEKLHNVFLAGADYHVGFGNGYIEGAVRSGQRAADLVIERLSKRKSVG